MGENSDSREDERVLRRKKRSKSVFLPRERIDKGAGGILKISKDDWAVDAGKGDGASLVVVQRKRGR